MSAFEDIVRLGLFVQRVARRKITPQPVQTHTVHEVVRDRPVIHQTTVEKTVEKPVTIREVTKIIEQPIIKREVVKETVREVRVQPFNPAFPPISKLDIMALEKRLGSIEAIHAELRALDEAIPHVDDPAPLQARMEALEAILEGIQQSLQNLNRRGGTAMPAVVPVSRGGTGATVFTVGSIPFVGPSGLTEDNANLFFDDANNRLGVGTNTPGDLNPVTGDVDARIHVRADQNLNTYLVIENASSTGLTAAAVLRVLSDSAVVNFQAHGSARVISRFGVVLGGWAEYLTVAGNGLVIGTGNDKPLILGTNVLARMQLHSDGIQIGAPTGAGKGVDTLNVAGGYFQNGARLGLMMPFSFTGGVAAGATSFRNPFVSDATESNAQIVIPGATTMRKLYVRMVTAQPGTGSLVFTIRKNGVDTAVTVTVAAGAGAGVYSDVAHSVAFAEGDLFTLSILNNAAGASGTFLPMVACDP